MHFGCQRHPLKLTTHPFRRCCFDHGRKDTATGLSEFIGFFVELKTCRSRKDVIERLTPFGVCQAEKLRRNFTKTNQRFREELGAGTMHFVAGFEDERKLSGNIRYPPVLDLRKFSATTATAPASGATMKREDESVNCRNKLEEDSERIARMMQESERLRKELRECRARFDESNRSINSLIMTLHRAAKQDPAARVKDTVSCSSVYNNYLPMALVSAKASVTPVNPAHGSAFSSSSSSSSHSSSSFAHHPPHSSLSARAGSAGAGTKNSAMAMGRPKMKPSLYTTSPSIHSAAPNQKRRLTDSPTAGIMPCKKQA
jgi:hypothetical protein